MKIISITGTKGKTTVTRAISHTLKELGNKTLRVDTDGHYINEVQKSTLQDSRNTFQKAPTVCPGKFLISMKKYYPDFVAILESSVGCNGHHGLGYGSHDVGIFTNVFEDHMGIGSLMTREDIAKAKSFIFKRISKDGGYAIYNADDKLVCSQLNKIPPSKQIKLLPVGITFEHFDHQKHLLDGGEIITTESDFIVIKSKNKTKKIVNFKKIPWTFDGLFVPSIYNLMFIVAGLYGFYQEKLPKEVGNILTSYRPDKHGGRLTLMQNKAGVSVLIDYAHEKISLAEVSALGNQLRKNRLIGVVRLAPDRTDKMILETGAHIANLYDDLIIYDKIDGIVRSKFVGKNTSIIREVGEVSSIFKNGVDSVKKDGICERIVPEEDAIKRAAQLSRPGDVVIIICGDDHKRTVRFVKECFHI